MPEEQSLCLNRIDSGNDYMMNVCLDYPNKRLRVDDYRGNTESVRKHADDLAKRHGFTKVFIKSREADWQAFLSAGYMLEGVCKGYFHGRDAIFMAKYFELERRTSDYWLEEDDILVQVLRLPVKTELPPLPADCRLRAALESDAEELAALYGQIFQTYPTPMGDVSYVRKVIREGTVFYMVEKADLLISAASAEINGTYRNAEITDCATLPAYRKSGFMRLLILALEDELLKRNVQCAYSLARALSFGMNASLAQLGYRYGGRLTKNCDIYDKFEDMNLWSKQIGRT